MKFGIIVFPGTWSDKDCKYAVSDNLGQKSKYIWHKETDLSGIDSIIIPGGFSFGDHLRVGALAQVSPIMNSIREYVKKGFPVIGICNGFQILCEAGILPGALIRNKNLQFKCKWTNLQVSNNNTIFSSEINSKKILKIPISHGEGNFQVDSKTLDEIENSGKVVFRYCDSNGTIDTESNPNGSINNIAGIMNKQGNVLGMMPHPERACNGNIGSNDGNLIFQSMINYVMK